MHVKERGFTIGVNSFSLCSSADSAGSTRKALIYVRVSTEEQAEKGYSLEGQTEDCRSRAQALGYRPEEVLVLADEASGALLSRPGLNRLRELVAAKPAPEIVILYDPDRMARKLAHQLLITEEIVKRKITLEFVNFTWNNTPEGRMFYQLRGMFSEFEREKIRERTIRGRLAKLAHYGKLSYDPRLYGYRFDTEQDVLLPHPEEAGTVARMFAWAADGESAGAIARRLAAEGVAAPRGSRWYGSTVSRILRNPSYLGTYMAYKVDYHQGFRRERPPEEQFALPVAPLVSAEVYAAAGRTLTLGRRAHGRPRLVARLAAGRAYCALCGRALTASYGAGGAVYYRCPAGVCPAKRYWNAANSDEWLWERVKATALSAFSRLVTEGLPPGSVSGKAAANAETGGASGSQESERLAAKQRKLAERRLRLVDLYLSAGISRDLYDRKAEELTTEQQRLDGQIAAEAKRQRSQERRLHPLLLLSSAAEITPAKQAELIQLAAGALDTAPFAVRQQIVALIVDRVLFHPDLILTVKYRLSARNSD